MFENPHDLYKSKEWQQLLENLKLERVNEEGKLICEYCGEEIVKAYDCIGHHKIPLNNINVNDYNISLNPENIMLIHFKCHNKVHHRFGYELPQKVYIVYGSPCSGKSTWVDEQATADDLIVDIDKIWDRFYKSDASRGRDKKGSGLGLSITKEIIQAHEEHIDVISTPDVGTEFIFTLPIAKG